MRTFSGNERSRRVRIAALISLAVAAPIGIAAAVRAGPEPALAHTPKKVAVTSTAVAPNANGLMTMVATDTRHEVWIRTQVAADTWSEWRWFGYDFANIVAQRNGNGLIELFGVKSDSTLHHRWQLAPNSNDWSNWEYSTQNMSHAPSALSLTAAADGGLTLFGVDTVGNLWGTTQYIGSNGSNGGGTWSPWVLMGEAMSTIAAQTNGNGLIELFAADLYGMPSHRWELTHNAGSWAPWEDFGASWMPSLTTITATTAGPGGAVVLFATDTEAVIWARTMYIGTNGSNGGGTWSPWSRMDGTMTGITAVSYPDRRIELFGINGTGQLFRRKEITAGAGHWSAWEVVPRPIR